MKAKSVVFILSLGRSGSTLLGYFLGIHPRILHIGEIPAPVSRGRPFRCRSCADAPCPVWGDALPEALVRRAVRGYDWWGRNPLLARLRPLDRLSTRSLGFEPPGAIHARLFERMAGVDTIVDGCKRPCWAGWNARSDAYASRFLVLLRDLRAVVTANRRRGSRSVEDLSRNAVRTSQRIQRFVADQPSDSVLTVRYESLVDAPREAGERICAFLGLPFDDSMLEFYRHPDHVIGGNPATTYQGLRWRGQETDHLSSHMVDSEWYDSKPPGFERDERWRDEMDESSRATFERIAGPFNRELGYSG